MTETAVKLRELAVENAQLRAELDAAKADIAMLIQKETDAANE